MTKTERIALEKYFYSLHDVGCNQKYNSTLPYSFHLEVVALQAEKYIHHIPSDDPYNYAVWVGVYGHDSIEDARLTYNDIKQNFGELAAEIIYLCTEDKGRNRAERKSDAWYQELKKNQDAVFVKLCDLMANIKFSILTNSSMLKKYKQEYESKVRPHLYSNDLEDMFTHLDKLLDI